MAVCTGVTLGCCVSTERAAGVADSPVDDCVVSDEVTDVDELSLFSHEEVVRGVEEAGQGRMCGSTAGAHWRDPRAKTLDCHAARSEWGTYFVVIVCLACTCECVEVELERVGQVLQVAEQVAENACYGGVLVVAEHASIRREGEQCMRGVSGSAVIIVLAVHNARRVAHSSVTIKDGIQRMQNRESHLRLACVGDGIEKDPQARGQLLSISPAAGRRVGAGAVVSVPVDRHRFGVAEPSADVGTAGTGCAVRPVGPPLAAGAVIAALRSPRRAGLPIPLSQR